MQKLILTILLSLLSLIFAQDWNCAGEPGLGFAQWKIKDNEITVKATIYNAAKGWGSVGFSKCKLNMLFGDSHFYQMDEE